MHCVNINFSALDFEKKYGKISFFVTCFSMNKDYIPCYEAIKVKTMTVSKIDTI